MNYFKLLALNIIVASIMAVALTGTSKADGVDDPKFYDAPKHVRTYGQVFEKCFSSRFNNMASICRQYDDMGPFNWPNDIIDLPPSTIVIEPGQIADVPEPPVALLIGFSCLMLGFYKVSCK